LKTKYGFLRKLVIILKMKEEKKIVERSPMQQMLEK